MKRICFVVSSPTTASVFLKDHINYLSNYYDIDILANFDKEHKEHKEHITRINVPIYRKINLIKDFIALLSLIKLFKKNEYVSVHSITPKAGLLAMTASFITGVPNRIHWYTGQVWVTKKGINRSLLKFADKLINFFSTSNLVDSESQFQFLIKNKIIGKKSKVIANGSICGVNTNRFYLNNKSRIKIRNELNINDDETVVLYLGRMVKDKGIFDLAESISNIGDESKICLLLVGEDEEGNIDKILGKKFKSNIRIIYRPFSNNPEDYFNSSDIYCMPSYREGFGLSILEAAACSIPAVAYDIYGVSDAVISNETGILVRVGKIDALTNAIEFLIKNPEKRWEMGQKALNRVQEFFTRELLVEGLRDFYLQNVGYLSSKTGSKILHISASGLTIKTFVEPFEAEFANRGFEVSYGVGEEEEFKFSNYISLPIKRGPYFPLAWLNYFKLKKIIFKNNPNIIFFHTPLSVFTFSPLLRLIKHKGIKLIYIARGSLDESQSWLTRFLWFLFDPTTWNIWDGIGVTNDYLYNKCLQKNRPVILLSIGGAPLNLGKTSAQMATSYIPREVLKLGWVGRLDKDKKLSDFIELLKILSENYSLSVKGKVVGASVPGDKPEQISTTASVDYYGWQDDPWKVLSDCDLLISTSIREGYGLVPVEAGFYGIPTIAYKNHGTFKSVTEIGGLLVESFNLIALAEQVIRWNALSDEEKIELRKNTSKKVNELIKKSNQSKELIDLIHLAGVH
jgi:glycosyltransferase involved in cell wall biosynthesis